MSTSSRRRITAFILAAFFVSGFTSLIYEILWVRLLTRYVGGSTFSVTLVLTVFMAGLAVGSWLAGRFVDRISDTRDLVRLYAVAEILIGLYAGAFPFIIRAFEPLYALLYRALDGSLIAFGSAAGVLSIALLIVPTTLMGATLPILSRYYIDSVSSTGTRTGRLYGINTIGAALGSLVCGVILLRWLGSHVTLAAAVAANLVIGLGFLVTVGFASSTRQAFIKNTVDVLRKNLRVPSPKFSRRSVVVMLAVSGACSMAYEVIWTKLLALLVGPTTYSFTLVLFTFITGLALGSIIFGWLCDHTKRPIYLLVGTQLAAATAALICSQFLGNSQTFFAKLLYACRDSVLLVETVKGFAVFLAMLPTTLFLGAIFPIAIRIETERVESVGAVVGRLYMFNTIGAVVGSVSAGLFLVPFLGKSVSLSLLALSQALVATLVIITNRSEERAHRGALVVWGTAILGLALVCPRWDTKALTKGKYHRFEEFAERLHSLSYTEALFAPEKLTAGTPDVDEMIYFRDGIGGFISVAQSVNSLGVTNVFLQISGKTDASSQNDLHTMTLTGQVPMLLHPTAKRGMVVGLASGITAGEMLHYPLEQLDVIEISPEVVDACRYFDQWNNGVLDDPRANIILQDARTHITLTDQIYDVIVSEPSNPWMAGVANLFTVEYFQSVREHLAPDGIFVQWYHAYQTDWDSFCLVGRTLTEVFPNSCIIRTSTTGSDYLMVAFKDSRVLDEYLQQIPDALPYAQRSQNMSMPTAHVLVPLVVAENPSELYGSGPLHTDIHPLLEFASLKKFYSGGTDILGHLFQGAQVSGAVRDVIKQLSDPARRLDFAEFMASMNVEPFGLSGLPSDVPQELSDRSIGIVERYSALNRTAYGRIMDEEERDICLSVHEDRMTRRLASAVQNRAQPHVLAVIHFDLGNVHAARAEWVPAITHFRQAGLLFEDYTPALKNLARCHEKAQDYSAAAQIYERLVQCEPGNPMLWAKLATAHLHLESPIKARLLFQKALQLDPEFAPALLAIGSLELQAGNLSHAITLLRDAIREDPRSIRAHQNISIALLESGQIHEAREYISRGLRLKQNDPLLTQLRQRLQAVQNRSH